MGRLLLCGVLVLLGAVPASAATRAACAPGRFDVDGGPMVYPGLPNRQSVVLTSSDVSIRGIYGSACPPAPVVVKAKKRGTLVKALLTPQCGPYARVLLTAVIDPGSCNVMTGTVRVAYPRSALRKARRFRAERRAVPTTCTDGLSTYDVIQRRIFAAHGCNVATCHGTFASGGLSLIADASYDQLVDVPAANPVAAAAGSRRVVPGDPTASFLVRKLRGTLAAGEGGAMPSVGTAIDADELAVLEAWIAGGAPRSGRVERAPCLPPAAFVPVTQPPVPAGGYQLELDGPTLAPGTEEEGCLWIPTPYAEDFLVGKWEFVLNPGTHHFAVFQYDKDGPPPVLNSWRQGDTGCTSGAMFGATLSGAPQAPYFVDTLPPGLGRVLKPGYLGLNAHYANDFDVPIQMKVWVNVHPYDGTPAHVVQTLTDYNDMFTIDVPPFTQKLQPGRFRNDAPRSLVIVQLSGHMHKRGLRFTARHPDGSVLFENYDWAHPVWWPYDPPLVLAPGDYLDYECLEDNGVTRDVKRDAAGAPSDLTFGLTTDDEMCTLTAVYYEP